MACMHQHQSTVLCIKVFKISFIEIPFHISKCHFNKAIYWHSFLKVVDVTWSTWIWRCEHCSFFCHFSYLFVAFMGVVYMSWKLTGGIISGVHMSSSRFTSLFKCAELAIVINPWFMWVMSVQFKLRICNLPQCFHWMGNLKFRSKSTLCNRKTTDFCPYRV